MVRSVPPVQEVGGGGEAHLAHGIAGFAQIIHPVLPIDPLADDRARLGPADVPFSLVRSQDDALTRPVVQVGGRREAQLRIALVFANASTLLYPV